VSDPVGDAAAAALAGRLIVIPTDTVYGIGTRADDPAATGALFDAKGRPRDLSIAVLVPSVPTAREIAVLDERAAALAARFWPGPLTMILPRTEASRRWDLGSDVRTIGVRVPHHPLALAVLAITGPLAVTSAWPCTCARTSRSRGPPRPWWTSPTGTFGSFGPARSPRRTSWRRSRPDTRGIGLRSGRRPMLDSRLDPMAQVLLVCTGNICRSPMAEGLLRSAFVRRLGDRAPHVASAGAIARDGARAMPEAVEAAAELGVDISGHSARRLRREHIRDAVLIVGMAAEHREDIQALVPEAEARTFTLKELVRVLEAAGPPPADATRDGGFLAGAVADAHRRRAGWPAVPGEDDVMDPLGLSLQGYRAVASEVGDLCERLAGGLYDGSHVASGRVD
jgi:protein-tyrosine-phosphatase